MITYEIYSRSGNYSSTNTCKTLKEFKEIKQVLAENGQKITLVKVGQ